MNNDLISRKALIEAYDKAHKGTPGGARKLMEEAPGVDAVEVVHGEWVKSKHPLGFYMCSVCQSNDKECQRFYSNTCNYCPHCGAKMDGGKEK